MATCVWWSPFQAVQVEVQLLFYFTPVPRCLESDSSRGGRVVSFVQSEAQDSLKIEREIS